MATDARLSTSLPSHPKTKKLVRQLGAQAGWSLICLILWAASNRSDGDLSGMDDDDIELAADWDGEPGAFIAALRRIRFVDGEDGDTQIHDWTEHQPWAAGSEARSLKARWNAVKRHHGEHAADREVPEYAAIRQAGSKQAAQQQHATQDASSTTDACSSPSPILSVSSPTPTLGEMPSASAPAPRAARTPPPTRPEGVGEQVWTDWLALRKAKKAPVTDTVLSSAKDEAAKAGLTLEAFLRVWCARGSQGLQADWLRPNERAGPAQANGRKDRQLQTAAALTGAPQRQPTKTAEVIDVDSRVIAS